ncbi:MAG TPA: RNA polymerase sigma factor FliA [Rhodocyclaceae bacterium]
MYTAAGQLESDQLVEHFAPLVKRIAHYLVARLPASVHIDDLIQNGMIGLIEAMSRYQTGLGAQFETYATQRIRGAMLDGLREADWLPRSLRRELRRVDALIHQLEQDFGRPPSETELADGLGLSLAEYQKLLLDARGHQVLHMEDMVSDDEDDFLERHFTDDEADPARILEELGMRESLVGAIGDLPEREKLVMALYYDEELNLREIGEVLGVTESRVCQLHSQAIARLRAVVGASEPVVAIKRSRRRG